MKKFAFTLFLAFVLVFSSVNTFAGEIPLVGRTCPPNTTCLTDGEIPLGGLASGDKQADEPTIFKTVIDYLAQLFG
jgi:hypothetical protein